MALKTIIDFLRQEQHEINELRMVSYAREDETAYEVFEQALKTLLGPL